MADNLAEIHKCVDKILKECKYRTPAAEQGLALLGRVKRIKNIDLIKKRVKQALLKLSGWNSLEARRLKAQLKKLLENDSQKQPAKPAVVDVDRVHELLKDFLSYYGRDFPGSLHAREAINKALEIDSAKEIKPAVIEVLDYMKHARGSATATKYELRRIFNLPGNK